MNEVESLIKDRMIPKIPEGSELNSSSFEGAGWSNQVLNFGTGQIDVMLKYTLVYRAKKKNGEMASRLSKMETSVRMSHCPFCGVNKE